MAKRELIQPNNNDKRYLRRDEKGRFTDDQTDVGRSLTADRRRSSATKPPRGQGDRGDR